MYTICMKLLRRHKKRDRFSRLLYLNIFIKYFSACFIIIGCISTVNYYITRNSLQNIIEKYDISLLRQIESSVESMHSITSSIANSFYSDYNISRLLEGPLREIEITEIYNMVNQRILPYPLIHSLYVYDGIHEKVYTFGKVNSIRDTQDFLDYEAVNFVKNIDNLKDLRPIPRKIVNLTDPTSTSNEVYSYFLVDKNFNNNIVDKAIIINIEKNWLTNFLHDTQIDKQFGDTDLYITNDSGLVIANDDEESHIVNFYHTDLLTEIKAAKTREGVIYTSWNNSRQVASYIRMDNPDWFLISLKPSRSFMANIITNRNWVLFVSGVFSIMGILLSLFITNKLFNPIERMRSILHPFRETADAKSITFSNSLNSFFSLSISKFSRLEKIEDSLTASKKEMLLNDLLNGDFIPNSNDDYDNIVLDICFGDCYILFYIDIDKHYQFIDNYSKDEQISILKGLQELSRKPIKEEYCCEIAIVDDFSLVGIVSTVKSNAEKAIKENLLVILKRIQKFAYEKLNISITISLSNPFNHITAVPDGKAQLATLSKYKLLNDYGSIITEEILGKRVLVFDLQNEANDIIQSLLSRKYQLLQSFVIQYFKNLKLYSVDVIHYGISYLIIRVYDELKLLEQKGLYDFRINFNDLNNRISNQELLSEIQNEFQFFLKQVENILESGKKSKDVTLVDSLKQYIVDNYSDTNLCLKAAADTFGYSPEYLGKTFKRIQLTSFADYIKEYRLNIAENLLITTNLSISTIMYRIGWINEKYFYTVFKKMHGLSPRNFRLRHRQKL